MSARHKHDWQCTDTPGIYVCPSEGTVGYWNRVSREIEEEA